MMTQAQKDYIMNSWAWVKDKRDAYGLFGHKGDALRAEAIGIFNQRYAYKWDWDTMTSEDASSLISIMKMLKERVEK